MPLPNTRVIPAGWSAHHAPIPRGAANARIRAERAVGSWWDEDTQSTLTTWEVLYDGPARIQQHNVTGPDDTAGDVDQRRRYLVAAGLECPALPHDTPVLVVECVEDLSLQGRTLYVEDAMHGSYRWERDLLCVFDLDRARR